MNAPPDPAVARAAEFRLIGLLLERPKEGSRAAIEALAREVGDDALKALADRLAAFDEPSYVALLGPGGPVSPREAAYCRREDPGRIMADLAGFYRAFAFEPRTEDPPDHVAVETGFAGYLHLKEAYARMRGDAEAADVTIAARGRFLAEHLAPLAAGMAARLAAVAVPDLLSLVQSLQSRVGLPARPIDAEGGDDDELTCGPCASPEG